MFYRSVVDFGSMSIVRWFGTQKFQKLSIVMLQLSHRLQLCVLHIKGDIIFGGRGCWIAFE